MSDVVSVYRHSKCKVCKHVAVDKINLLMINAEPKFSAKDIRNWMLQHYPTEDAPGLAAILNHKNKHLRGVMPDEEIGKLKIDRRTGKLVDQRGRKVEAVGIIAAVKTIVSVGIANIMNDPRSVSPTITMDALKLLKQLNLQDDDPDSDIWAEAVVNPDALPKRGRGRPYKNANELLDDITEIIDVTEESDNPTEVSSEYDDEDDGFDYDNDLPDPTEFDETNDEHNS